MHEPLITDSGGVQKESYFFNTPCVVAREQTEWVELVHTGWTVLAGSDDKKIVESTLNFWDNPMEKDEQPIFGDGNASGKIADIISRM